jgi:protein-glutamine gamma-glutamyltransferase
MHRVRAGAAALSSGGRCRPAGFSRGASSLVFAGLLSAAIALLTGAVAVIVLLVGLLVAFGAGVLAGWWTVRHADVDAVSTATLVDAGDELAWRVQSRSRARVHGELRIGGAPVAAGWLDDGATLLHGTAPRRGEYDRVEVRWAAAGRMGMYWWRRTRLLPIATLSVAPRAAESAAPVDRSGSASSEHLAASLLAGRDDVDGVRSWREGDELTAVHWPATLRTGELVIRQRHRDVDERWLVHARAGSADPDGEAARVRTAVDSGLASGARVSVQVSDGASPAVDLAGSDEARRWCAAFDPVAARTTTPFWQRRVGAHSPEPERRLAHSARWAVAAASVPPLVMMLQPLRYGPAPIAVVVAMIALGAAFSAQGPERRRVARQLTGLLASLAAAAALIDPDAITSVVNSLRFLLPQLLVTLVVMQGFECIDRRAARITLSCSAMLTAYAAGIRVDPALSTWLLVSAAGIAVAWQAITRADHTPRTSALLASDTPRWRGRVRAASVLAGSVAAMLALLAVIPVPEGPAQLTLPSWIDDYRPTPGDGGLVAANGSPLLGGGGSSSDRTSNTSRSGAGGYPGFSPTMDTSLRGDLGDDVVLRVRSPYPDYWRGQTFSDFDGRVWTVDGAKGTLSTGVDHPISPTNGDVPRLDDDDLIQTYYAEVDLPNIVFAAYRAERVLLEASLWRRPDGALRADVVLPAGSAYTVVSRRKDVTVEGLRAEGDITDPRTPEQFLALPDGITDRTVTLARELQQPTTYDTIVAIQAWLAANVEYDLDAPIPPDGADAVDDFLFESQRGFCEQIATATAMLLRSLGVPARIATGYVPSERDAVAGVWISRASDAHAWVEVRFPDAGWVAFDPTSSVPLAGEAQLGTIGGALARAIAAAISQHLALVLGGALLLALLAAAAGLVRGWWHRRRRGRWGLLQDRFLAAALRRGGRVTRPNAELAGVFDDPLAAAVAHALDSAAFAEPWIDDDDAYRHALAALEHVEAVR